MLKKLKARDSEKCFRKMFEPNTDALIATFKQPFRKIREQKWGKTQDKHNERNAFEHDSWNRFS